MPHRLEVFVENQQMFIWEKNIPVCVSDSLLLTPLFNGMHLSTDIHAESLFHPSRIQPKAKCSFEIMGENQRGGVDDAV